MMCHSTQLANSIADIQRGEITSSTDNMTAQHAAPSRDPEPRSLRRPAMRVGMHSSLNASGCSMCILVIVLGSMRLGRARSAETGRLRCLPPAVPYGATHCACRSVRGKKMKCAGSLCSLARIQDLDRTPSPATNGMSTGTGVAPQAAPRPPENVVSGFNPRKCPDCRCVEFATAVQVAAARFRAAAEVANLHGAESGSVYLGVTVTTAAALPETLDSATKVVAATVTAPPSTAKASSRRQRPDMQVVAQNKNEAFYDENYFRNHQVCVSQRISQPAPPPFSQDAQ